MNPVRLRAYFLLLIMSVIFGIAGPVIKLTLKGLPADIFLFYRFFLTSIAALTIFAFRGFRFPKKAKVIFMLVTYAFMTTTVALGLLFWGLDKTTVLDMSLISVFGPILVIVAGSMFLGENVTKREKIGILITLLGSVILIIEPILAAGHDGRLTGNLIIVGSVVATAISSILLKKVLREGVDPLFLTNISFVIGFLTMIPIVLFGHSLPYILHTIYLAPFPYHLGVFYMAFLSGTLAYTLGNIAQKTIEISEAALFSYVYPIFSAILAILFLGDKLTLPAIIGSIITFAGVFIAEVKRRKVIQP